MAEEGSDASHAQPSGRSADEVTELSTAANAARRVVGGTVIDVDIENRYGGGAAEGLPEERS